MCEKDDRNLVRTRNMAEIEITPEMIKAGADEVWEFRGFDPNYVAEKVFQAMAKLATMKNLTQRISS